MRILMANYEFPPVGGGGATANYYLAREMVAEGHEVAVVTSGFRGLPKRETVEGVEVLRVPVYRQRRDFTRMHEMLQYVISGAPRAALMGLGGRWDVVQTFFAVPSGLAGWWASRMGRIPHVIRLGGGDLPGHEKRFGTTHRLIKPVLSCLLKGAAARVVNSDGLRDRAKELYPKLDFEVIYNGVDREMFRPAPTPPPGPPTVLFVSRLIERKGLQHLLDALAEVAAEGLEFRLKVVGDGPMREKLQEQTARLGLLQQVEFMGLQPRSRLPEIYRSAHIFCLPSASEGMANVVLEALASGLPLVVTDVPGTRELVEEGQNGFVVDSAGPEILAAPLQKLIADGELRRSMGETSRERSKPFAWSKMAQKYIALYRSLTDGSR
ncbi:MAG: glycosyltransferase family 4 protein [Armatimonadota bacterium]